MIIALPATDHDHLADALVRDLGFARTHVDAPLRDLLLALDPVVDVGGIAMANMGGSPRLSGWLERVGGKDVEDRWTRLLNPPRPGSKPDAVAKEVKRLLEVLRNHGAVDTSWDEGPGDVVAVGATTADTDCLVAIRGRGDYAGADHWLEPAGVVGEQQAIVAYVQELRMVDGTRSGKFVEAMVMAKDAADHATPEDLAEAQRLADELAPEMERLVAARAANPPT